MEYLAMGDRVSKLPDEVLCHILSFLPTEEAVATTLLSKRWTPLWLLVSTLDFDEQRFLLPGGNRSRSSFIHFVSTTILARDLHQPIKTLRVKSNSRIPDLKIWLNAAIQRQVESIEIDFSSSLYERFNIFSCKTLVVLKLRWVHFETFSSVELPSLKTLHLHVVGFSKCQQFMELLYGCPILENLQVKYLLFDSPSFEQEDKSLAHLVRAHFSCFAHHYIPMKPFCNVEFLHLDKCWDVNVNNLVFPNVIHLELILGDYVKWNSLVDLLNHCPKLQTLVLEKLYRAHTVWSNSHVVPECFSSQLRKCFLTNFTGLECEMRFAMYVMRNSTSLRSMTISSKPDSDQAKKLRMITELASCPRSSVTCELLFK